MIARQSALMFATNLLADAGVAPAEQAVALRRAADRADANAVALARVPTMTAGEKLSDTVAELQAEATACRSVADQIEAKAKAEAAAKAEPPVALIKKPEEKKP